MLQSSLLFPVPLLPIINAVSYTHLDRARVRSSDQRTPAVDVRQLLPQHARHHGALPVSYTHLISGDVVRTLYL